MSVVVVPYDESWPATYGAEAARLTNALRSLVRRIEHVGSTAVSGLAAKPIVDIQISVSDRGAMRAAIDQLEGIGYRYEPIPGFEDYPFLGCPADPPRKFHVHLCLAGGDDERRHVAVRDLLRRDPVERERYAALKLDLARCGREEYIERKGPYLVALERRALASSSKALGDGNALAGEDGGQLEATS